MEKKHTTFVGIMAIVTFSVLCYITFAETKPKPKPTGEITIIPMNEDNDGRPLFVVKMNGKEQEYMYAEEIGVSLLRDSIIQDEMIHFCDHEECKENQ